MTKIEFNNEGDLISLNNGRVEFCAEDSAAGDGIFRFQARDTIGVPYQICKRDFRKTEVRKTANGWEISCSDCPNLRGSTVKISVETKGEETEWRIEAHPGSVFCRTEWIDFPKFHLKRFHDEQFLLPFSEGTLLKDIRQRQATSGFRCEYTEYPHNGIRNFYPGAVAMQFLAFFAGKEGLYIACDDPKHDCKTIDFRADDDKSSTAMLQCFTEGADSCGFPVVTRFFTGDWQDAAEIYRTWMEKNDPYLPKKLEGNLPDWVMDSPVVVAFPVRGQGCDCNSGMAPNEYFPYVNALPVLDYYRKRWNAPMMALLMHWEGSAPWAPPYIWPPYGGEDALKTFTDALHAKGDRVGLYASGIAWTQTSLLDPSYDCTERFKELHVEKEIAVGPLGEKFARICSNAQAIRLGYELCPGRDFTAKTACHEIACVNAAGIDYVQYFDQNLGAAAPLCYAHDHGHPDMLGPWLTDAMRNLLAKAKESAGSTVLGCENAAAEPYMEYCQLNDLRTHVAWGACGLPVPLYDYLFHEYCAGFTGNGCCLSEWIDMFRTPFFPCWNLSWNFVNGSLLTVVLKGQGKIHWNWAIPWEIPEPEQEPIITLVGNLTRWRRGPAKPYLTAGRMIQSPAVYSRDRMIILKNRPPQETPAILSAQWEANGKKALILVNYDTETEQCRVEFPAEICGTILCGQEKTAASGKSVMLTVPPLDCVMIEY